MFRIAVDAMGADAAPAPELDAVVQAVREREDLQVILVGDADRLRSELATRGSGESDRLRLRHATQIITMEDAPSSAVRTKKDSSMRVAFDLVKKKDADAVVSAGNSGAMLACGMLVTRRLAGALRPGIVTTFPTVTGVTALCDMGANVDVKPAVLAQFGVLGAVYARIEHGKKRPRVGILSNGEEESKGTDLTRGALEILKQVARGDDFEFAGYIEGKDIFAGEIDVVATDGFTGNIVLKTSEGAAHAMVQFLKTAFRSSTSAKVGALFAKNALKRFAAKIDYAETGGAPLLGVDGNVIICHGRSTAKAIKNAIFTAARFVERGLTTHVAQALSRHKDTWATYSEVAEKKQEIA